MGWLRRRRRVESSRMGGKPIRVDARRLRDEFAGKWVALRGDELVEAQDTPDRLYSVLHERRERGTTIFRVPAEGEPELVGLG